MEGKRNASEQVAFRVEPELAAMWSDLVAETLVPNRAHLVCAMLMYLAADPVRRDVVQRAYARFQRAGELDLPRSVFEGGPPSEVGPLSAEEVDLLRTWRAASEEARDEAIANLLDRPAAGARRRDTGETRDPRVG
ncbi:MAG: hypothetical protein ACOC7R_00355 [Planctomycetota bacterium]